MQPTLSPQIRLLECRGSGPSRSEKEIKKKGWLFQQNKQLTESGFYLLTN